MNWQSENAGNSATRGSRAQTSPDQGSRVSRIVSSIPRTGLKVKIPGGRALEKTGIQNDRIPINALYNLGGPDVRLIPTNRISSRPQLS